MELKSLLLSLAMAMCNICLADSFIEGSTAFQNKNYAVALEKWKSSTKDGNAYAMFNVGNIYYFGHGTQENHFEALQWFLKATSLSDGNAELFIGEIYRKGLGLNVDLVRSKAWLSIAELKGNKGASQLISSIESQMQPHQLAIANSYIELCKSKKLTSCSF